MRRTAAIVAVSGMLVSLAAGCVDGRSRPLTAVEEAGGRRDPTGPPLVYITAPQDGQKLPTPLWLTGSGIQVTYGGAYRDGDDLRVMAYLDYPKFSDTQPFHVTAFTIVGKPDGAVFIRGSDDQFRDATSVTILLEIHDPEGYLISVDSVVTPLR